MQGLSFFFGPKIYLEIWGLGAKWRTYPSGQASMLGVALLAIALVFLYLGIRIRSRIYRVHQKVGGLAGVFVFVTWVLSAVVVLFYFDRLTSFPGGGGLVPSPVSPVTETAAGLTFIAIFVSSLLRNRHMAKAVLLSAFVGTVVGVMIFELPFLFMISPQLGLLSLDRALWGLSPLFCLVFASYALLFLSPLAGISRYTFFSLCALFVVLSSWAFLTNFSFPSDPVSFALNSASKVLSFVSAITMFLHRAT